VYAENESLMLGQAVIGPHGLYGRHEFTVRAGEGVELAGKLGEILCRVLPAGLLAPPAEVDAGATLPASATPKPASQPDALELAAQQELTGLSVARATLEGARAEHLLEIYRAAKEVIRIQVDGEEDEMLQAAQADLNRLVRSRHLKRAVRQLQGVRQRSARALFARLNP
jgi:hypothetical protein